MIRKLRWKFIGISMAMVAAVLLVVFLAVFHTSRTNLEDTSAKVLHSAVERNNFGQSQPGKGEMQLPYFVVEIYNDSTYRYYGSSYYVTDGDAMNAILTACIAKNEASGTLSEYNLRYLRAQTAAGALRIAFVDTSVENATLRSLLVNSLVIGVAALLVLFGCCYLLSGVVTKPVGKAWQQQKQFVSDASHELKTPLTVILSSAGLLAEDLKDPQQLHYVDNIRSESDRMKKLVEGMLTLARSDRVEKAVLVPTDLSDLALDVALLFEPVAYEQHRQLSYDIGEGVKVEGNAESLRRLISVLLDNAIKYAPQGEQVRLTLSAEDRRAKLMVENGGEPIPPEQLAHLFERFYRADASRTDTTGFGLGLSIAQSIAAEHRGTLRAESDRTSTRFILTLPLLKQKM
jgi:two-component system sensor histidine kinase CiaH